MFRVAKLQALWKKLTHKEYKKEGWGGFEEGPMFLMDQTFAGTLMVGVN